MFKAVHFGAGNIGKGFIGMVLNESGYSVCFVDVDFESVNELKKTKKYTLQLLDERKTTIEVGHVFAFHAWIEQESVIDSIVNSDMITTSVGVGNLEKIAPLIAGGLLARIEANKEPIDIIANENMMNATSKLKDEIAKLTDADDFQKIQQYTGFANSAIDRQALSINVDGQEITTVEPYYEWIINESELINQNIPRFKDAVYVRDMSSYIERKLYIVNAAHAAAAYVGFLMKKSTVQEALVDEKIFNFVRGLMYENSRYLAHEYAMPEEDLIAFIDKTLERFKNPYIKDDVTRVGRSPLRKLGENERIIAPLRKIAERGLPITYGTKLVAAALLYHDDSDNEAILMQQSILECGIREMVEKYTSLNDSKVIDVICKNYLELSKNHTSIYA